MRRGWRLVVAMGLVIAPLGLSAPAPAAPPDVNAWFAHLTPPGSTVTYGRPAPVLGWDHLPAFDLETATLASPASLDDLVPTGEYCARKVVGGVPSDAVSCAAPTANGEAYQWISSDEMRFLRSYPDADLPAAGSPLPAMTSSASTATRWCPWMRPRQPLSGFPESTPPPSSR